MLLLNLRCYWRDCAVMVACDVMAMLRNLLIFELCLIVFIMDSSATMKIKDEAPIGVSKLAISMNNEITIASLIILCLTATN